MGFVERKKSGNIFAGSRLVVDGQGIYNVKIINARSSAFLLILIYQKNSGPSGGWTHDFPVNSRML